MKKPLLLTALLLLFACVTSAQTVEPSLLHEIGADIVVGVAELRIQRDRQAALIDRIVEPVEIAVRPAQERVRLGGGAGGDGILVERDGVLVALRHLLLQRLMEQALGPLFRVGGVHRRDDIASAPAAA